MGEERYWRPTAGTVVITGAEIAMRVQRRFTASILTWYLLFHAMATGSSRDRIQRVRRQYGASRAAARDCPQQVIRQPEICLQEPGSILCHGANREPVSATVDCLPAALACRTLPEDSVDHGQIGCEYYGTFSRGL